MENSQFQANKVDKPRDLSGQDLKQILKRIFKQIQIDHIQIVSAEIACYFFLTLLPTLTSAISIYGLMMESEEVQHQLSAISPALPQQSKEILSGTLNDIASRSHSNLSWPLLLGLAISQLRGNRATITVFEGVNIAFNEINDNKLLKKYGITLSFTNGGILK